MQMQLVHEGSFMDCSNMALLHLTSFQFILRNVLSYNKLGRSEKIVCKEFLPSFLSVIVLASSLTMNTLGQIKGPVHSPVSTLWQLLIADIEKKCKNKMNMQQQFAGVLFQPLKICHSGTTEQNLLPLLFFQALEGEIFDYFFQ